MSTTRPSRPESTTTTRRRRPRSLSPRLTTRARRLRSPRRRARRNSNEKLKIKNAKWKIVGKPLSLPFCIFNFAFCISSGELFGENLLHCAGDASGGHLQKFRGRVKVAEEKPKVMNEISDETGQHDARFLLWRRFCADNNI